MNEESKVDPITKDPKEELLSQKPWVGPWGRPIELRANLANKPLRKNINS